MIIILVCFNYLVMVIDLEIGDCVVCDCDQVVEMIWVWFLDVFLEVREVFVWLQVVLNWYEYIGEFEVFLWISVEYVDVVGGDECGLVILVGCFGLE